jgi:phasin family protein
MTEEYTSFSDWTKANNGLDLTKGSEELLKLMSELQVPGIDMDALAASQRNNLEALNTANRAVLAGFKAVGEWQMWIMQETVQELTAAINDLARVGSPHELVATETELTKKAIETAARQMRELAQIVNKANQEASDAIVRRIPESLGEIRDVLKIPL